MFLYAGVRRLAAAFRLAPVVATLSFAAGCSAAVPPGTDDIVENEAELRGDTAYVRAVASAFEAATEHDRHWIEQALVKLRGGPFSASLGKVDATRLSAHWQERLDIEMEKYQSFDPERGHETPILLETYNVIRNGRVMGMVANVGIVQSLRPLDEEAEPEAFEGHWLWFGASRKLQAQARW